MFKLHATDKKLLQVMMIVFILMLSVTVNAQDKEQVSLVQADSTWQTEIIPFPVDWLPRLTFEGFEELRFAPNWSNEEHEEFWTLVMAWQVDTKKEVVLEDIQFNFNHYFEELMTPNHWAKDFPSPQLTITDLDTANSGLLFKGKMTFFDGFHTGKVITVSILGNQVYCETLSKSIIVFRLSPKTYNELIWEDLNAIIINEKACKD